ncbi:hypothetical protein E2C01_081196 [Portunus trituberculatus]|uniref:Uncharacterized protein n=1 Tax=Portunus trituberculatus TaxID=210409 RepID=A0A5B7ILK7_PORTR|nr:hypothetical protein [Portunus trituberculatus]
MPEFPQQNVWFTLALAPLVLAAPGVANCAPTQPTTFILSALTPPFKLVHSGDG